MTQSKLIHFSDSDLCEIEKHPFYGNQTQKLKQGDKIFVYGTLKSTHGNNPVLGNSKFICHAKTNLEFPLAIQGLPYLMMAPNFGFNVIGELWEPTKNDWPRLDMLEGHPEFYKRFKIDILCDNNKVVKSWAYFLNQLPQTGQYFNQYL